MPLFINEVRFRGDIQRAAETTDTSASGAATGMDPQARAQLVAEVTEAVLDQLERTLDRIGER